MLFADDAVVATSGEHASREGTVYSVAGTCCYVNFDGAPADTKPIRVKTEFLRPKYPDERHTRARDITFVLLCGTLYSCSHSVCLVLAVLCHDVAIIPLGDLQAWINEFEDREGVDLVVVRSRGTGLRVRIVDGEHQLILTCVRAFLL